MREITIVVLSTAVGLALVGGAWLARSHTKPTETRAELAAPPPVGELPAGYWFEYDSVNKNYRACGQSMGCTFRRSTKEAAAALAFQDAEWERMRSREKWEKVQ